MLGEQVQVQARPMSNLVKTALFTIIVPGSITAGGPYLILRHSFWPARRFVLLSWAGGVLIPLGVAVYCLCAWQFCWAGNGTPSPLWPARRLVTTRLYGAIRNPMYLGVVLVLAGEALWFQSVALLLYCAMFLAATSLFVLFYEEPYLLRTHGQEYQEYCASVPRWFPKLQRRR
jgi:protein-S-isoprenylcysteine O-methyltransferase Ste14